MTGGSTYNVQGGRTGTFVESAKTNGNVAIVAGDCNIIRDVVGGFVSGSGTAKDNQVHLVGKGASVTIADAQGNTGSYTGGTITTNLIAGGRILGSGDSIGNSIDIYGNGIVAHYLWAGTFQQLNFHIADSASTDAMLTLTTGGLLDLTGFLVPTESQTPDLALTFDALDSLEWKPSSSVTLENAAEGIKMDEALLAKEYKIYQHGDPDKIAGTATLKLEQGQGSAQSLKLVMNGDVPEPATGTLSLLALAALAARRRRK